MTTAEMVMLGLVVLDLALSAYAWRRFVALRNDRNHLLHHLVTHGCMDAGVRVGRAREAMQNAARLGTRYAARLPN